MWRTRTNRESDTLTKLVELAESSQVNRNGESDRVHVGPLPHDLRCTTPVNQMSCLPMDFFLSEVSYRVLLRGCFYLVCTTMCVWAYVAVIFGSLFLFVRPL